MLISEAYRKQNRELHATSSYGVSGDKHTDLVRHVYRTVGATSLLDYGCGKQYLTAAAPELVITPYDPCIDGLDVPPEPHDVVYCGDVLEHIEPDCIDAVLDDVARLTLKAALLVTTSRPAVKFLPDGRNAHLIQQPMWWWAQKICARMRIATYERRKNDHIFLVHHHPNKGFE